MNVLDMHALLSESICHAVNMGRDLLRRFIEEETPGYTED
jgi:hypothetical protein